MPRSRAWPPAERVAARPRSKPPPTHDRRTRVVTRTDVQAWLESYVEAWRSGDAAAIGDLFSDDASYRYHPYVEPYRGRDAIVRSWLEPEGDAGDFRDAPGTWEASYSVWAMDGDRAVATGTSRFWTDASRTTGAGTWSNCFLLEFDDDGRCRAYTEFSSEHS